MKRSTAKKLNIFILIVFIVLLIGFMYMMISSILKPSNSEKENNFFTTSYIEWNGEGKVTLNLLDKKLSEIELGEPISFIEKNHNKVIFKGNSGKYYFLENNNNKLELLSIQLQEKPLDFALGKDGFYVLFKDKINYYSKAGNQSKAISLPYSRIETYNDLIFAFINNRIEVMNLEENKLIDTIELGGKPLQIKSSEENLIVVTDFGNDYSSESLRKNTLLHIDLNEIAVKKALPINRNLKLKTVDKENVYLMDKELEQINYNSYNLEKFNMSIGTLFDVYNGDIITLNNNQIMMLKIGSSINWTTPSKAGIVGICFL